MKDFAELINIDEQLTAGERSKLSQILEIALLNEQIKGMYEHLRAKLQAIETTTDRLQRTALLTSAIEHVSEINHMELRKSKIVGE